MGLIIPVIHLAKFLPSDANDSHGYMTTSVTEASAFVNTWTSRRYEEWDDYEEDSDDEYTLNAPREITQICTSIAKHMYFMNTGYVQRDGSEEMDHEARIDYYRGILEKIDVRPTRHELVLSLDSDGYQLIARNQNILTHKAKIVTLTSAGTNVWNLGKHFWILKGGLIDAEDYFNDGWYVDGSTYKDELEGTLTYYRSYRNDGKDYMMSYKTSWDKI